jgi:hypothetical protein
MMDWTQRYSDPPGREEAPYQVQRTPRGSVVICVAHVVTEEVKDEEAVALANALNEEHQRRNAP